MPGYLYGVVAAAWFVWFTPFVLAHRSAKRAARRKETRSVQLDPRARWGMVLQAIGYAILWQNPFWTRSPPAWRVALSFVCLSLACLLSWTATPSLGPQWRLDAGLNPDHELVTSGPYRIVRHPIYASMLCLLIGMGLLVSSFPLLIAGTAILVAGTEIRVHIEEKLLASRFGDSFAHYRRNVPAYVPFLR